MLVAICLVGCVGCGASGAGHGSALNGSGPQATGFLGYTAADTVVGDSYWFGFPVLYNRDSRPVVVTGYGLGKIDPGISVTYFVYSLAAGSQVYVTYRPGIDGEALMKVKNYAAAGFTIAPRAKSGFLVMAQIKVLSRHKLPAVATTCVVMYRQGSRRYVQNFDCDFELGRH